MLKNITLSAEERLIEQARLRAQQDKQTLNAVFRDWLHRYVARDAAATRYRSLMRQLRHVRAGRKLSREEANER